MDDTTRFSARVAGPTHSLAGVIARLLPRPRSLATVANDLRKDPLALRRGTAHLIAGEPALALRVYAAVPSAARDAAFWTESSAAQLRMVDEAHDPSRLLACIDAADRALILDADDARALFNRALAVESLGLSNVAARNWGMCLRFEPQERWSNIARAHLARNAATEASAWQRAIQAEDDLCPEDYDLLSRRFPQQARRYAEGLYLAQWAEAWKLRDALTAREALDRTRTVARVVMSSSGDSLLRDTLTVIDRGGASLDTIASGQLAYRDGRIAYKSGDLATAELQLRRSATLLRRGGSPTAVNAEVFITNVLLDQHRLDEASSILDRLLHEESRVGVDHLGARAQVLWNVALREAVAGRWSDSLLAASTSLDLYRRLGERGNEAAVEAILSEDFDLLGQRDLAWKHGVAALKNAATNGDDERVRVILAALCRTEIRARRWDNAATLVKLEKECGMTLPRLEVDRLVRSAVVEFHRGRAEESRRSLGWARTAVLRLKDPASRAKSLAEIDAIAGSLLRTADPATASTLLSAAIAYQQSAERPIVLPELFLERGRAERALGRPAQAAADFEAGIRELERERRRVTDALLRPGIFDDAFDLFEEAISLQMERGADAAEVLETVERGRARALLEQLESRRAANAVPWSTIRRRTYIAANRCVIEYAALPGKLLIFRIASDGVTLVTVSIPRARLIQLANGYVAALSAAAPTEEIRRRSTALYDALIGPVESQLKQTTSLVFVPDDVLNRIPFATLLDHRSRYLIERATISIAPSLRVFATVTTLSLAVGPLQNAVVFANPAIPRDRYPSLPSLYGSEDEAVMVRRHYAHTAVFLGQDATDSRFIAVVPDAQVVHFTGHATPLPETSESSALLLASDGTTSGVLTVRMISQLRFRATRVVVLAACSTLAGRNAAVEGVATLARAFLVAGAPAVIGTLWDIQDRQAVPLMDTFHSEIARGVAPAAALRNAQLAAIHSQSANQQSPSRWGAFAVTGD